MCRLPAARLGSDGLLPYLCQSSRSLLLRLLVGLDSARSLVRLDRNLFLRRLVGPDSGSLVRLERSQLLRRLVDPDSGSLIHIDRSLLLRRLVDLDSGSLIRLDRSLLLRRFVDLDSGILVRLDMSCRSLLHRLMHVHQSRKNERLLDALLAPTALDAQRPPSSIGKVEACCAAGSPLSLDARPIFSAD